MTFNPSNEEWKKEPASPGQIDYINGMVKDKDLTPLSVEQKMWLSVSENITQLNKGQASKVIESLKGLNWKPKQPTQPSPAPPVGGSSDGGPSREGRFFIVDPTDGQEKFIHITMNVRASDTLYQITDATHRNEILKAIAKADPTLAMNEYGIRLNQCGVCGRTLTNHDSRLRGIGPVCASRLTTPATPEEIQDLKDLGLIDEDE